MTSQYFWKECRSNAADSLKEAFRGLPPQYYLAAVFLLPVALPALALRLAFGWAADRLATQWEAQAPSAPQQGRSIARNAAMVPQKA